MRVVRLQPTPDETFLDETWSGDSAVRGLPADRGRTPWERASPCVFERLGFGDPFGVQKPLAIASAGPITAWGAPAPG